MTRDEQIAAAFKCMNAAIRTAWKRDKEATTANLAEALGLLRAAGFIA